MLAGSNFYGVCSNMEAEFLAFFEGLKKLYDFGLEVYKVVIESDSIIFIDMVRGKIAIQWRMWKIWKEICSRLSALQFEINHVFREANQVADGLANYGVIRGEFQIYPHFSGYVISR